MPLRECTVSVSTIIHRCPACAGLRYSVIYVRKLASGSHFVTFKSYIGHIIWFYMSNDIVESKRGVVW